MQCATSQDMKARKGHIKLWATLTTADLHHQPSRKALFLPVVDLAFLAMQCDDKQPSTSRSKQPRTNLYSPISFHSTVSEYYVQNRKHTCCGWYLQYMPRTYPIEIAPLSLSLSIGIYIYIIYIYHIYQYSFTLYDYSQADLDSYSDHFVPSYVHTLWSSYSVLEQLLHKPLIWCRGAHVPRHLLSKTSHSMPWSHTSPSSFNIILYIIFALYFNMLRYASTNHEHMCIVIVTFVVLVAHIILSYTTHYHTI